jgi:hypothetical protein
MMINKILKIVFLFVLVSCSEEEKVSYNLNENKETPQKTILEEEALEDACPEKSFEKTYGQNITVKAEFLDCESKWKYNLKIYYQDKEIYRADSLEEFEFNNYIFPTHIINSSFEYILIEQNDRPLINFMKGYRIKNHKIDSVFEMPLFSETPFDINGDGIKEYISVKTDTEMLFDGTRAYNPELVYKITDTTLVFDLKTTKMVNEKLFGKFYGLEYDESIMFEQKKVSENRKKLFENVPTTKKK